MPRRNRYDTGRTETIRREIVNIIEDLLPEDGKVDAFGELRLIRSSRPHEPAQAVYQPAFCFVAQGSKRASVGSEVFIYHPSNYLIFTVDLPVVFEIEKASRDLPYLGVRLNLNPSLVASAIAEGGLNVHKRHAGIKAMDVGPISFDLIDAIARLVRLVAQPEEGKVLAPLVMKEIIYRLLIGGQGARLAHMTTSGETRRISRAIGHLRDHYDEPLKIETVAHELGMSVSGFHHQFKSVTSMSPLQFQKQIRLQEARRLMLGENLDAASAGFRVGYDDPSYFSRDYKKHFGAPPQRDIANLRDTLNA